MTGHEEYMRLAITNARAMKGQTDPNPLVGAVVVNDGRIVGVGAHLKAGEPHAEIHALRMAGTHAQGATMYVTLEPCSHHGRTGPCAEAIVAAGIREVVVATLDPNPIVSGRGIEILQNAGIDVIVGVCEDESRQMNEVFNKFIVRRLPFVTLKAAVTLDGKIATTTSDSKWITSDAARTDVHTLRNEHGAILVGANTVLKDNPELTARIPNGRNPIRVVLDSTLKIPLESKLVTDNKAPTWVFTTRNHSREKRAALQAAGVRVFETVSSEQVDLHEMLQTLSEHDVSSLLVEGGGAVSASFLERKLIDKVVVYIAPKLVGGKDAPTFLEGAGIASMNDAIDLVNLSICTVGSDIRIAGYPKYAESRTSMI